MAFSAKFRTIASVVGLALACSGGASADVAGFNAAMNKGDLQGAAREAASTWTTWDKTDAQTALLAREFGFVSLLAGKPAEAEMFGKFLVENGAALPTPDDQPLTSAVLYHVAVERQKDSGKNRDALRDALEARATAPGIELTSVVGWEVLYNAEWAAQDNEAAIKDATAAAAFMKRDEKGMLVRRRTAELAAASARFTRDRNRPTTIRISSYNSLADVHDTIAADINSAATPAERDKLWPLKWRANAWIYAAESYINADYQQVGSLIDKRGERRQLVQPHFAQVPEDTGLPLCDGKFEGTPLRYPGSKESRGLVGSVIVRIETDVNGRVTKVVVLASVPVDTFSKTVIDAISTWQLKPAAGVDTSTCSLSTRNYVYSTTFTMG